MRHSSKKWLLFLLPLCGMFFPAAAENLLPNPEFKHGTAGYYLGNTGDFRTIPVSLSPLQQGNALHFEAAPGRLTALYLPEVIFRKGTEYELSFDAKCSTSQTHLWVSEYNKWSGNCASWGIKSFALDREWKRCTYRFRPDAMPPWKVSRFAAETASCHGGFRLINQGGGKEAVTISIAKLYLGPVGHPVPESAVTAAFRFERQDRRFLPGEKAAFPIEIINHTDTAQDVLLKWSLLNLLEDERVETSGTIRLNGIEPGRLEHSLELKLPEKNGAFRLTGAVNGVPVIAPVGLATLRPARTSRGELPLDIGVDELLSNIPASLSRQEVDFLADSGISLLRDRTYVAWKLLEPERGKFSGAELGRLLDYTEQAGLQLIPVVGDMFWTAKGYGINPTAPMTLCLPEWLCKSSPLVPGPLTGDQRMTILPPLQEWRRMVRSLAEFSKGRIRIYEIFNEPFSFLTAPQHLEYLSAAYEILKKTDPSCTILGGSLTGDLNRNLVKDLNSMLKAAGRNNICCDAISFHPYNNLFEDSHDSGELMFRLFRESLAGYGYENIPLWNTELYYLNPDSIGGSDGRSGPHFHPGYLIRRFLLDAAQQVPASILLRSSQMMDVTFNENFQRGAWGPFFMRAFLPNGNYIATAAFADTLRGTRFAGSRTVMPGNVRIYRFEGEKRAVAAIFALDTRKGETRRLKLPLQDSAVRATDVFGNLLETDARGNCELPASGVPVYLTASAAGQLDKVLAGLKITGIQPVKATPGRMAVFPHGKTLYTEFLPIQKGSHTVELRIGGEAPISVPTNPKRELKEVDCGEIPADHTFQVNGITFPFSVCRGVSVPRLPAAPELADPANSRAWDKAVVLDMRSDVKVKIGHHGGSLYFRVQVPDITPYRKSDSKLWTGDSVELFLDAEPLNMLNEPRYRDPVTTQLIFAPSSGEFPEMTEGGTSLHRRLIERRFHVMKDGYLFLARIPLRQLYFDPHGIFGFDLKVNDFDTTGIHRYSSIWSGSDINYKNRFVFGLGRLEP